MSIDGGGDNSPQASKLDEITQREFASGSKLTTHVFNKWRNVGAWFAVTGKRKEQLGPLQPLNHYEEYVRESYRKEDEADEVIARSDRGAVAAFDALVDEFNAHLEEIIQKGIVEAEKYLSRARKLQREYCQ
jgi:hypothetical protein